MLIIGGVHGDERRCRSFLRTYGRVHEKLSFEFGVAMVPCLNLDGFLRDTRQNSHGVDLNRNLPTNDGDADYDRAFLSRDGSE